MTRGRVTSISRAVVTPGKQRRLGGPVPTGGAEVKATRWVDGQERRRAAKRTMAVTVKAGPAYWQYRPNRLTVMVSAPLGCKSKAYPRNPDANREDYHTNDSHPYYPFSHAAWIGV